MEAKSIRLFKEDDRLTIVIDGCSPNLELLIGTLVNKAVGSPLEDNTTVVKGIEPPKVEYNPPKIKEDKEVNIETPDGEPIEEREIPIGKYKGKMPSEIARKNPIETISYVVWLINNKYKTDDMLKLAGRKALGFVTEDNIDKVLKSIEKFNLPITKDNVFGELRKMFS